MACEDYPCCGHAPGDCPDAQGRMKCVSCGKRMSKTATSSICATCTKRLQRTGYAEVDDAERFGYDSNLDFLY